MAIRIKKLKPEDLSLVEAMSAKKIEATTTDNRIFQDPLHSPIYRHFILADHVYGSELFSCYGYFDNDNLLGTIGMRRLRNEPAWVLSFIVTNDVCNDSISVIKSLLNTGIDHQESKGCFQWFVVSKLAKFRAWQKLFKNARQDYHHYVYARTLANELPKWRGALEISGNKLFPYDTNISMYISKKICTTDDDGKTVEIDEGLL